MDKFPFREFAKFKILTIIILYLYIIDYWIHEYFRFNCVKYYGNVLGYGGEIISKSIHLKDHFCNFGDNSKFDIDVIIQDSCCIHKK